MKSGDFDISATSADGKFEVKGDATRLLKSLARMGFQGALWLIVMKMHICTRGAQAALDMGVTTNTMQFDESVRGQITAVCASLGPSQGQSAGCSLQ